MVNPANTFVQALSHAQLEQIFTGAVTTLNQVDPSYPAEPIAVFSPDVASGTFDYFVEEVLNDNAAALENLPVAVLSEADTELVTGIEATPNAIGYFGYAYFQAEGDLLRAVPIDGGVGAVAPGADTVADGSYPLARPLFVYTSARNLERLAVIHITALDADAESLNAPLQPDESPTEQGDPKNGPKRRGTSGEMAKLLI